MVSPAQAKLRGIEIGQFRDENGDFASILRGGRRARCERADLGRVSSRCHHAASAAISVAATAPPGGFASIE